MRLAPPLLPCISRGHSSLQHAPSCALPLRLCAGHSFCLAYLSLPSHLAHRGSPLSTSIPVRHTLTPSLPERIPHPLPCNSASTARFSCRPVMMLCRVLSLPQGLGAPSRPAGICTKEEEATSGSTHHAPGLWLSTPGGMISPGCP